MVQEVRIVSDEEIRSRMNAQTRIAMMVIFWGIGSLLDAFAVEPLLDWLAENNLPVWWMWLMDHTASLPSYVFGSDKPGGWLGSLMESEAIWAIIAQVAIVITSLAMMFLYTEALMSVIVLTVFLAIPAFVIAFFAAFWMYLLGLVVLGVLWVAYYVFLSK